jgi:hypothetical protein
VEELLRYPRVICWDVDRIAVRCHHSEPVWSRDRRELVLPECQQDDAGQHCGGPSLHRFTPSRPFRYQFSGTSVSGYDISPDGRRFLMVQPAQTAPPATEIHIALNWFEELKNRFSTNKQ